MLETLQKLDLEALQAVRDEADDKGDKLLYRAVDYVITRLITNVEFGCDTDARLVSNSAYYLRKAAVEEDLS